MMLAEHLSTNNEHYTPPFIIEAARKVLGHIDLDPASCALANRTVKADRYITQVEDGLSKTWTGRVFLNPPGGRRGSISGQKKWWRRLADEYAAGRVTAAIYLGFNIQILQTSQVRGTAGMLLPMHFPMCIPSRRLRFFHAKDDQLVESKRPAHASVIVFLPPRSEPGAVVEFTKIFAPIGAVCGGSS